MVTRFQNVGMDDKGEIFTDHERYLEMNHGQQLYTDKDVRHDVENLNPRDTKKNYFIINHGLFL